MAEENQLLQVIRVWAAVAWADGEVVDEEAQAMKRLIEAADLTAPETERALGYLDSRVDLDTVGLQSLPEPARHGIYRAAVRLATVDRHVAVEERAFLDRLRHGLRIAASEAAAIEADIPVP